MTKTPPRITFVTDVTDFMTKAPQRVTFVTDVADFMTKAPQRVTFVTDLADFVTNCILLGISPAFSNVIQKFYNLCRIILCNQFQTGIFEIGKTFEIIAQMAAHLKHSYPVSLN